MWAGITLMWGKTPLQKQCWPAMGKIWKTKTRPPVVKTHRLVAFAPFYTASNTHTYTDTDMRAHAPLQQRFGNSETEGSLWWHRNFAKGDEAVLKARWETIE